MASATSSIGERILQFSIYLVRPRRAKLSHDVTFNDFACSNCASPPKFRARAIISSPKRFETNPIEIFGNLTNFTMLSKWKLLQLTVASFTEAILLHHHNIFLFNVTFESMQRALVFFFELLTNIIWHIQVMCAL